MTLRASDLAAHMESTRVDGHYMPITTTAGVEAVVGVNAPAGESWRVIGAYDSRGDSWLLVKRTATTLIRELGSGPHTELAHDLIELEGA